MAISPGGRPADDTPVGTPGGRQNWVDKAGGLPKYVRMVAHALMRKGMAEQHAIAAAVNRIKRWAAGADNVRPQVQAAAAAALAEWEAKKGMALSAHVDASLLLDLSVPDVWLAELRGTFDPSATLDLAREYVRDQVGRFANDSTKHQGGDRKAGDEKAINRNRDVTPRDLSSLKGLKALMLDWRRVPMSERAATKARMKSAARRLGATDRLLALIDGLGDGDAKKEKGEGSALALRQDKAHSWLKSQGFNLSATDAEAELVLELAAAVGDELDGASLIDLAGDPGATLDLAPGDYHPPYDWKHGYIPITPAAALSKAKKGPHVGRGGSRGRPKGVRVPGKTARGPGGARPKAVAGKGKGSSKRDAEVRGVQDRIEARTGNRPTFAQAEAALGHAERIESDKPSSGKDAFRGKGGKKTPIPSAAASSPEGQARIAAHRKALDDEARGRGVPGAVDRAVGSSSLNRAQLEDMAKSGRPAIRDAAKRQLAKLDADKPKAKPAAAGAHRGPERVSDSLHRDGKPTQAERTETTEQVRRELEKARKDGREHVIVEKGGKAVGVNVATGVVTPYGGRHNVAERDREKAGGIVDLNGAIVKGGPSFGEQQVRADLEATAHTRRPPGGTRKNLPGGGSYPTKVDGSPDYGAMSSEQAATIRAKEAGRGVGAHVDTDQGPGTVKSVSSRSTTIELDDPDKGAITVVSGTPGHDRIKPRPKGGAGSTGDRISNREAAGATDTGKARRLAADRVLLDGQQYERVIGPNGGYTWRGSGNADVKDMDTRRKLDEAAPLSGSAVAAARIENNRKTEAEGGPSSTPPTRTERAMFPEGQKVAYNGRPSDGTGVVVGRRTDSQGTVLEVKDDKDGKTYEWAPDHVKPHDAGGRQAEILGGLREREARRAEVVRRGLASESGARTKSDDELRKLLKDADDRAGKPSTARNPGVSPGARTTPPAPSTSSTNPDAAIRIEHTPDGTLVHGTSREDAADIKAVGGFKWSRNLNAWYLPRTWRPETREAKVRQLEAKLGDKAGVDKTTGPRKSAAEREADTRARAAERAERMDARADKRTAEAERRFEASDLREEKSGIPFGQPILVGHHSERRHRRALDRAHANLGKGVEAQREAESARASADRARRTAAGTESKVTIGNRIAKNEREVRDLERRLAGTHPSSRRKPEGEYRQRLEGMLAEAQDQLQHDQGKMAAAGGVPSKASVSPGDFVKIRGQWYPVRKANAKTVGHPHWTGGNGTSPWHEVQEHRKAGDVTRADVADMVRETSQAFPSLKTALAKAAPEKDATPNAPRAEGADANGITVGPAAAQVSAPGAWTARRNDDGTVTVLSPNGVELGKVRQIKAGKRKGQWAARAEGRAGADYGANPEAAIDGLYDSYQGKAGEAAKARGQSAGAATPGTTPRNPLARSNSRPPATTRKPADPDVARSEKRAANPGGIDQLAARRMSDEQLERAMSRLMENGDYDGPAFGVIESELNRRDKARRAEGN